MKWGPLRKGPSHIGREGDGSFPGMPWLHTPHLALDYRVLLVTSKTGVYLFPSAVTMASKELSYLNKGRLCPERVDSMNSDSPKYFLVSG